MKLDTYSSLAAFLAHWRSLQHAAAGTLAADDVARSAEMEKIIGVLRPEERAALEAAKDYDSSADHRSAGDHAVRRHRERAEFRLARELRVRGTLAT
jgi:hypothetical protein